MEVEGPGQVVPVGLVSMGPVRLDYPARRQSRMAFRLLSLNLRLNMTNMIEADDQFFPFSDFFVFRLFENP